MAKIELTYAVKQVLKRIILTEIVFWVLFVVLFGQLSKAGRLNGKLLLLEPQMLNWFWLLIPIIGVFIYSVYANDRLYSNAGKVMQKTIFKPLNSAKSFTSFILFRTSFALIVIALAQPAFGKKKVQGVTKSMELVVCLDISNSMNTMDLNENISRLGVAKRAINELINRLGGEKIGISVFANEAYTQLPLTLDYYAAKMFVTDIETDMITKQGTNIRAALTNALATFSDDKKMSKAIILLTDGENHDEDPSQVLAEVKDKNVQLAVVGIGTIKGGLVPAKAGTTEMGYKKNAMGLPVHSKLNEKFLADIANKGGGKSYISESAFPDLRGIVNQLSALKMQSSVSDQFEIDEQKYQIPLALGLICFVAYLLFNNRLLERRTTA